MISEVIEADRYAYICLIWEAKLGDGPLIGSYTQQAVPDSKSTSTATTNKITSSRALDCFIQHD